MKIPFIHRKQTIQSQMILIIINKIQINKIPNHIIVTKKCARSTGYQDTDKQTMYLTCITEACKKKKKPLLLNNFLCPT